MTNSLISDRDRFSAGHPEKRIVANGREWGVVQAGDAGPALVLIPGTLGRADIFWQQIEALDERARILALTYPSSGGIADWADDLIVLMNRLGIERATILGSSLGGFLAQYFAAVHPERTERLIAANTLHSVAEVSGRPPYDSDILATPIDVLRTGFGRGLTAWADTYPDQKPLVELLLVEVHGRIPEAELRTRLNALKLGPELPHVSLGAESMATIEGADDPLIPENVRQAVRARLEPAVAYRFAWGGHFPYVVRPQLYTAILEEQLGLRVTGESWGTSAVRER